MQGRKGIHAIRLTTYIHERYQFRQYHIVYHGFVTSEQILKRIGNLFVCQTVAEIGNPHGNPASPPPSGFAGQTYPP